MSIEAVSSRSTDSMKSSGVNPEASTFAAVSAVFLFGVPGFRPAPSLLPPFDTTLISSDCFSILPVIEHHRDRTAQLNEGIGFVRVQPLGCELGIEKATSFDRVSRNDD